MTAASFRDYPLRWVALFAALAGIAIALGQRLDPMLNPDSIAFVALAKSLLAGAGMKYREPLIPGLDLYAFRAPGYVFFLAATLPLGMAFVVGVQGALCGLSAALLGAIARGLGGGARAAWIAFAIRVAWPTAWYHSGLLLSEVFYEFLTILATWLVLVSLERRRPAFAIAAAAATALAILVRPVGLGLALALGIALLLRHPKAAIAYGLLTLAFWAPWPIRNARVLHAFVPFTTNGGATAWGGTNHDEVRPTYDWMGAHVAVGEVGFDRHFRDEARANVRRDPKAFVKDVARRAFVYLGPVRGRQSELWVHRFAMLAALGGVVLAGARRKLLVPFVNWAAQGAIMLPIFLIERYRFPTEWCVVLAAALGLEALAERIGRRRAAWAAGIALAACLAGTWVAHRGMRP